MEVLPSNENSQQAPVSSDDGAPNPHADDVAADVPNHRDAEQEDTEQKDDVVSKEEEDEVRDVLQAIASSGSFWHDWDKLKAMLSFQLKQVLSDYPEAKMTNEQQYASLGESYTELVNKLDEALTCFIEGPPFTLQRLCEILLDPKSIYPHLSKLALALEKNLLVTSTLTISSAPYPQTLVQEQNDQENADDQKDTNEKQMQQSDRAENGIEPLVVADTDEVMAEAEADAGDDMKTETEALEDTKPSETNSETNANDA